VRDERVAAASRRPSASNEAPAHRDRSCASVLGVSARLQPPPGGPPPPRARRAAPEYALTPLDPPALDRSDCRQRQHLAASRTTFPSSASPSEPTTSFAAEPGTASTITSASTTAWSGVLWSLPLGCLSPPRAERAADVAGADDRDPSSDPQRLDHGLGDLAARDCCWPVIKRPSRTTKALNRPLWT
jgi:hypothetical protein